MADATKRGCSKQYPANIYLFKVNNRNSRKTYEICSKLTIKTQQRGHWSRSGVFIVILNIIDTFFYCFHCWLWTTKFSKCSTCSFLINSSGTVDFSEICKLPSWNFSKNFDSKSFDSLFLRYSKCNYVLPKLSRKNN